LNFKKFIILDQNIFKKSSFDSSMNERSLQIRNLAFGPFWAILGHFGLFCFKPFYAF
jgi:hypothetical protein